MTKPGRLAAAIVLFCSARLVLSDCPPRRPDPDPPGWAIDYASPEQIFGTRISPDGKWLAFNSGGAIWLADNTGQRQKLLIPCVAVSTTLAFNPASDTLALGDGNGVIRLFDIPGGGLKREIRTGQYPLDLVFGRTPVLVAVRAWGLSVWNTANGSRLLDLETTDCRGPCTVESFDEIAVSADGNLIAIADNRYTFAIQVRDLSGRVLLSLPQPESQGAFIFDPQRNDVLVVARQKEFVFWNVRKGSAVARVPHAASASRKITTLPGSPNTFVLAEFPQVRTFDRDTGRTLRTWRSIDGFTDVTPDGEMALSQNVVWRLKTQQRIGEVRYIKGETAAPWRVSSAYLARRIADKEPHLFLVFAILLLAGCIGYVLCRRSPWLVVLALPLPLVPSVWWLRELFAPARGPGIAVAVGPVAIGTSMAVIAAALSLPLLSIFRRSSGDRAEGIPLRWSLAVLQTTLAGLLIVASVSQVAADQARLQVERDVAAGGELRGGALQPWYYSPVLWEFGTALHAPIMPIQGPFCRWQNRTGTAAIAMALVFSLWWMVGANLDGRLRRSTPGNRLLARTLALLLALALAAIVFGSTRVGLQHGAPIFWIRTTGFLGWSVGLIGAVVRGMLRDRTRAASAA